MPTVDTRSSKQLLNSKSQAPDSDRVERDDRLLLVKVPAQANASHAGLHAMRRQPHRLHAC
eukprot:386573-Pyramimonas_sp.AAC.1